MRTVAFFLAATSLLAADGDKIFEAMQAELKRSATLTLNQLEKPYFISYSIDEGRSWTATATNGGLISSTASKFRVPEVHIRVGDYKFDNTNYSGGGSGGARYNLGSFPLEDDPLVIRQYLWLATDSAYKGSLQQIARKRAALRSVTVKEQLPDLAPASKFTLLQNYKEIPFDHQAWVDRTRKISTLFNDFPALRTSLIEYTAVDGLHRFINSEGTEIRHADSLGSVQIRASAQAPDGMIVRDSAIFYTNDIAKMFPETELTNAARDVGTQVMKMTEAPIGENYTGPILFEGVASAQLMAEVLGRNLHIARKPVAAAGSPNQASSTELEGRRGVRIMPESFAVTDDPTRKGFGQEDVDDEGVPDQKISLVEKGVLKDFLRTREPVRGYTESNGRARLSGSTPAPTNLIVTSQETNSVQDLKKKIIDLCQQRGLAYGIIIRKMDFPSTAPIDEARRILASAGAGRTAVSMPLHVYRLYTDGHEEMIRGVRLRGLNARSLKDILAAGNDTTTFDYLENGAPFALLGLGSSAAAVSVVAPSVLIDDLELTKVDDELQKLPIAPAPALQAAAAR